MIQEEMSVIRQRLDKVVANTKRKDVVEYFKQQFDLSDGDLGVLLGVSRQTVHRLKKGVAQPYAYLALAFLMQEVRR
jgi:DNA-binding XRE family transcriptional regulator